MQNCSNVTKARTNREGESSTVQSGYQPTWDMRRRMMAE